MKKLTGIWFAFASNAILEARGSGNMSLRALTAFGLVIVFLLAGSPGIAYSQAPPERRMSRKDWLDLERNLRWIIARQRAGEQREPRVGVFADAGVWHVGARSIVDALEREDISCVVLDRSMLKPDVLDQLEAVVVPGGWAPNQWAVAEDKGLKSLRYYVESGGRCLGICAGAYLLSRDVDWEGRKYRYPLGLFDGTAKGPIVGLATYPKPSAVRLMPTDVAAKRGLTSMLDRTFYYNGGPCFVGGTSVEVLARFPDGSVAVASRPVGDGEVVLIGVHFERPIPTHGGEEAPPPTNAGRLFRNLLFPEQR